MVDDLKPIQLAGTTLHPHNHVCAFFHSQDEEYQIMLPFIKEGVERGERAVHIVDPRLSQDHHRRLEDAGINTTELTNSKQLDVRVWEETYLSSEGRFDKNNMLELIEDLIINGKNEGFPRSRFVGHMEWALEDRPGVEDVLEYESRLNAMLPDYHDPVICVYDLAKFGAATVIEILRTHPMVIIGGILQNNPFYVPTDEYLKELQTRRA